MNATHRSTRRATLEARSDLRSRIPWTRWARILLCLIALTGLEHWISMRGFFPEGCREARACTGLHQPPPPEIASERSAVAKVREGLYRWPSESVTPEEILAGPLCSTEPMLVILYKFKDTANPFANSTQATWEAKLFGDSVSVSDYYNEVSYGSLSFSKASETSGTNDNGVVGWYTSNKNFGDYGGRGSIIYDAIVASDGHVNYANYDSNADGYISDDELHIVVIAAAYEASYWDGPTPKVWRVNWWMTESPGNYPTLDGKKICVRGHGTTAIIGERYYKGQNNASVLSEFGVIAHEVGHQLGFPDLYDTDNSSLCYGGKGQGLGYWDLMASGDWLAVQGQESGHNPSHVSAWSKAYRGWLIPTAVTEDANGVTIQRAADNAVAYKLWTSGQYGGNNKQYFLVENRQKTGYDRALPGCGLLIYHVDEAVKDGDADGDRESNWLDNHLEWDATHEFIDVETADGYTRNADGSACNLGCPNCARDDLDVYTWRLDSCPNTTPNFDNRGDTNDPWFQGNKTTFDRDSCPSSKDYNGNDTKVKVKNISACGQNMTADLIVGAPNPNNPNVWIKDCAADVGNEPSGCNPWWVSPDIWIDNDRDGVQDAPSQGNQNRFFIGVRNRGNGPAVNVAVKLYHRSNSTGLTFPTGATLDGTQVIGLVPVGGAVRTEMLTTVPNPPANGHWCYGVTLDVTGDALNVNSGLTQTNNKACVNITQLFGRAGQDIPADFMAGNPDDNSSPGGGTFNLQVTSNLLPGFTVELIPGAPLPVFLQKGQEVPMRIVVHAPAGDFHGPVGVVRVEQYWVSPPLGVTGGIEFPIFQDNRRPSAVADLVADAVADSTLGEWGNPLHVRLRWTPIVADVNGTPEMIRVYEVHRSLQEGFTPEPATAIGLASADADPSAPGFQFFDHDPDLQRRVTYYYRVVPVDHVDWRGDPSNQASAIFDPIRPYADLDVGNIVLSVTDRGILGFLDGTQTQGSGFLFPRTGANQLYIGGLWVGRDPSYVANRDFDDDPEKEWAVSLDPDGFIADDAGPADQGYRCVFRDTAGSSSLGLLVRQESFAWSEGGAGRYAILRYEIQNTGGSTLGGLYAGLYCDWDVGTQVTQNRGRVEAGRDLVYVYSEAAGIWVGARLLRGAQTPPVANLTLVDNPTFVWPNAYLLDADKFLFLSAGDPAHILTESPAPADYSALVSAGPFTLAPGALQEVTVALVAGSSLAALQAAADAADGRYPFDPADVSLADPHRGVGIRLAPARPNPFRSATRLAFYQSTAGLVEAEIYDISGRRLRTVAEGEFPAGWSGVDWDGSDGNGNRLPAGVYLARVRTAGAEDARRIVLLR